MNLSGQTPGNSYKAILTLPTAAPVGGVVYRVEWGDGTGTALYVGNGIVGIGMGALAMSQITSAATAVRAVTLPDQAGQVCIATNLKTVLGSDFTHNSAVATDVTAMVLTLPEGTWAVTFTGRLQSSNNDNGVILSTGGTATVLGGTFFGDTTSSPATAADFGHTATVIAQVASGTGTLQLRAANESASRTLTVKSGAVLYALRIA